MYTGVGLRQSGPAAPFVMVTGMGGPDTGEMQAT